MSSTRTTRVAGGAADPRRCAIYTRTPLAESGVAGRVTPEDQRRVCQSYVEQQPGWVLMAERFDDRGFSGANLDRPALQRLLSQVDASRVDVVVVQRADVLSRWYLDFVSLMERMRATRTTFVAVSEGFSTASAAGQNLLGMLLSFAELQRAAAPPEERGPAVGGRWS